MCIMEIRPGQHASTMQQACTHNLGTILNDQDMFAHVLSSRDPQRVERVRELQAQLQGVYSEMCSLYGEMVADEVLHLSHYTEHHDHEHGEERGETEPLVDWNKVREAAATAAREVAEQDLFRARKYETR